MNAWNAGDYLQRIRSAMSCSIHTWVKLTPSLSPKDFVGEAVQLNLVQFGEHRLDQLRLSSARSGLA